jgi:hypothetical protein
MTNEKGSRRLPVELPQTRNEAASTLVHRRLMNPIFFTHYFGLDRTPIIRKSAKYIDDILKEAKKRRVTPI